MTMSLAQPDAALPPPPPPASAPGWIDLEEAARRSGWGDGSLRRKCSDAKRCRDPRGTWQQRGLARLVEQDGARSRWLVHESADPRLAAVKSAEQQADAQLDLKTLSTAQQQEILRKESLVLGFERAMAQAVVQGVSKVDAGRRFADEAGVSHRALQLWLASYRVNARAGLVDERWRQAAEAKPAGDDPFLLEVQRLWLDKRGRSMQLAYDGALLAAEEAGWRTCSYKTASRHLRRLDGRAVALHRGGSEAYLAAASCVRRDYTTIDSNDLWVGDHHRLDVVCVGADGKPCRPWLTAWMDMRSRLIVGWHVYEQDPNADRIADALVMGIERHGAPRAVLVDNGKDYDSFCLQGQTKRERRRREAAANVDGGILGRLGIRVTHARPYRPQSKPIERFFGTLAARFSQDQDTYCGRSPDTKPEDLQRQITRHAKRVEEVAADLAAWLDADYQHKPHAGDGMNGQSPADVFAANLHRKVVVKPELLAELRLERTRPVLVSRNGVTWMGITYGRREPLLEKLQGQRVVLGIDPAEPARVRVYAADDGRWVCNVRPNQKIPVVADKQLVREAAAEEKRDLRKARDYHRVKPRLGTDRVERLHALAARKREQQRANRPDGPGPSLVPLRSPLEDQLGDLQTAVLNDRLRPAVGAESAPLPDLAGAMRGLRGGEGRGERQTTTTAGTDAFSLLVQRSREARQ